MVRLKDQVTEGNNQRIYYFNSSMVRLKVPLGLIAQPVANAFQFLNGSIKRGLLYTYIFPVPKFQFLNGSIKSPLSVKKLEYIARFQFLNGSIKRGGWHQIS